LIGESPRNFEQIYVPVHDREVGERFHHRGDMPHVVLCALRELLPFDEPSLPFNVLGQGKKPCEQIRRPYALGWAFPFSVALNP
jgi:hypothetical protein